MKKSIITILLLMFYMVIYAQWEIITNEFELKLPPLPPFSFTDMEVPRDGGCQEFTISLKSGFVLDQFVLPDYQTPVIPDTMGWEPVTRSVLSTPSKTYGFEYIGFTDTGGQVESLSCRLLSPAVICFKPNLTTRSISGKVTISYYTVMIVGGQRTKFSRTLEFNYSQAYTDRNYLVKTTIGKNGIENKDIVYYDGLGKPIQQVGVAASPDGKDLVTHMEYSADGQTIKRNYLPYAANDGSGVFREAVINDQVSFYQQNYSEDAQYAFVENSYENSPSKRLIQTYQPGKIFRNLDKKKEFGYGRNGSERIFQLQLTKTEEVYVKGFYPVGALQKEMIRDEDGNESCVYKNSRGLIVLERSYADSGTPMDTYYVYNDFDQLCWVFTPEASSRLQSLMNVSPRDSIAIDYCYIYRYDNGLNMHLRRLPGCEDELYLYDYTGQVVGYQNGEMRKAGKWLLYKYDVIGRIVEQRLVNTIQFPLLNKGCLDNDELQELYTNPGILLASYEYDAYRGEDLPFVSNDTLVFKKDDRTKGLKTAERIAILKDLNDTKPDYIKRKFYYNRQGSVGQVVETNILGNISRYSDGYDRQKDEDVKKEEHTAASGWKAEVEYRYTYDRRGRLLGEKTFVHGTKYADVNYRYDRLGRLKNVIYGNRLDSTTYKYGIQGNIEHISNSAFTMNFRYAKPLKATPSYKGNISEQEWKTRNDDAVKLYAFKYDQADRLNEARYFENGSETNANAVRDLRYDLNGNILNLQRMSNGNLVDNLSYLYKGNQLAALLDHTDNPQLAASGAFKYDANGNMVKEMGSSGKEFEYNLLNLLYREKYTGTTYQYTLDGKKLSVTDKNNNGYFYLGNCIYSRQNGELLLEKILFSQGFMQYNSNGNTPHYMLTDHLNNVRGILNGRTGHIEEENEYYPFGACFLNSNKPQFALNRNKYNSQEKQTIGGIDYLDYGARMYNPAIGRWLTVDPMAEHYYSLSGYSYGGNMVPNTMDVGGKLFIFVNGYHIKNWNKFYVKPLGPQRKDFYGWNNIDQLYMATYNDRNAIYINGGFLKGGQRAYPSKNRYNAGVEQGRDMISLISSGEISLAEGESIKIVSYSMGGAFAAGIAEALIEGGYGDRIQFMDYLAPFQANEFSHPSGIYGRQIKSKGDMIAKTLISNMNEYWLFEGGRLSNLGGHLLDDYFSSLVKFCLKNKIPIYISY